jgi:hypothetical protein
MGFFEVEMEFGVHFPSALKLTKKMVLMDKCRGLEDCF